MPDCSMLDSCGFLRKYRDTQDLACRGFINSYCRGAKQADCARLRFRAQHGCPPEEDMLPSGHLMPRHLGGRG